MADNDCIVSTQRLFPFPPQHVYDAFRFPERLARWWGPAGFTNTFHQFDFQTGGRWVFTMHGPNGANYENDSEFRELAESERIVIHHISRPHFVLAITLTPDGGGTLLRWNQEFDTPEIAAKMARLSKTANEQNLDRLAEVLRESDTAA